MRIKGKISAIGQGLNPDLDLDLQVQIELDLAALQRATDLLPEPLKTDQYLTAGSIETTLQDILTRYKPQTPTGISMLLNWPEHFYETSFPEIMRGLIREKRWLHFETPNRVRVTHEYTVDTSVFPRDRNSVYLFSPRSRLAWLQVDIDGKPVGIAPAGHARQMLRNLLEPELNSLIHIMHAKFTELSPNYRLSVGALELLILKLLYSMPGAMPAFVFFPREIAKSRADAIITAQYFDAFQSTPSMQRRYWPSLAQLWEERELLYTLSPKSMDSTVWLYLKAPPNFHISCYPYSAAHTATSETRSVDWGVYSDPEIASIWFGERKKSQHLGQSEGQKDIPISILVSVPKTLKLWLGIVVLLSAITLVWVIMTLLDKMDFATNLNLTQLAITQDCLAVNASQGALLSAIFAMLALIMTARGWLIQEETVLAPITKWYALLSVMLLFCMIFVVLVFAK